MESLTVIYFKQQVGEGGKFNYYKIYYRKKIIALQNT